MSDHLIPGQGLDRESLIERLTDPDADSLTMHEACLDAADALRQHQGYIDAFYEIAAILGVSGPQAASPQQVFETQIKPRLMNAVAARNTRAGTQQ